MLKIFSLLLLSSLVSLAAPKTIKVFVALCDNQSQGIAPVGKSIGDGNKPHANLYWGCSDGLPKVFKKSSKWASTSLKKDLTKDILRQAIFTHKSTKSKLTAVAYRGTAMKQCYLDFEKAVAAGKDDFVCYIGHNALMDFVAPAITPVANKTKTKVSVLSCVSDSFCSKRIKAMGAEPVLMTKSLMYPGSFILHDALEKWLDGKGKKALRAAAGAAYFKNQKKVNPRLSLRGATGVFADLSKKK